MSLNDLKAELKEFDAGVDRIVKAYNEINHRIHTKPQKRPYFLISILVIILICLTGILAYLSLNLAFPLKVVEIHHNITQINNETMVPIIYHEIQEKEVIKHNVSKEAVDYMNQILDNHYPVGKTNFKEER